MRLLFHVMPTAFTLHLVEHLNQSSQLLECGGRRPLHRPLHLKDLKIPLPVREYPVNK